jgi:polyhydroxyalkanoate synthesis regulator phasin
MEVKKMIYCGTGYTTLDDLEYRLDGAVERGELTEQEAWEELQDAAARERYEQEMDNYMQRQMMEEEPYLF